MRLRRLWHEKGWSRWCRPCHRTAAAFGASGCCHDAGMLDDLAALPADIAICAAAVADWAVDGAGASKLKKTDGAPPELQFKENPDILATISAHQQRPKLVIGFAAETDDVIAYAKAKRARKGCDWILANDVGQDQPVFGADENEVHLITASGQPLAAHVET